MKTYSCIKWVNLTSLYTQQINIKVNNRYLHTLTIKSSRSGDERFLKRWSPWVKNSWKICLLVQLLLLLLFLLFYYFMFVLMQSLTFPRWEKITYFLFSKSKPCNKICLHQHRVMSTQLHRSTQFPHTSTAQFVHCYSTIVVPTG